MAAGRRARRGFRLDEIVRPPGILRPIRSTATQLRITRSGRVTSRREPFIRQFSTDDVLLMNIRVQLPDILEVPRRLRRVMRLLRQPENQDFRRVARGIANEFNHEAVDAANAFLDQEDLHKKFHKAPIIFIFFILLECLIIVIHHHWQ